jgi:hypothetical protein
MRCILGDHDRNAKGDVGTRLELRIIFKIRRAHMCLFFGLNQSVATADQGKIDVEHRINVSANFFNMQVVGVAHGGVEIFDNTDALFGFSTRGLDDRIWRFGVAVCRV